VNKNRTIFVVVAIVGVSIALGNVFSGGNNSSADPTTQAASVTASPSTPPNYEQNKSKFEEAVKQDFLTKEANTGINDISISDTNCVPDPDTHSVGCSLNGRDSLGPLSVKATITCDPNTMQNSVPNCNVEYDPLNR